MDIVFFGSGKFGLPILKKLNTVFGIKAVFTQEDKPAGRGKKLTPTPIGQLAQSLDLKTIKVKKLDADFLKENLSFSQADLFVVVSFGEIIPKEFLSLPKFGTINVHPSILPKYRGASPIQSAILNGDGKTGLTVMLLDEELDHGPILFTKEISLSKEDTFESLNNNLSFLAADVLPQVIKDFIAGTIKPHIQDDAIAISCSRIRKEDGYFDISSPPPAEKLDKMIRAYYPWPTAWTKWSFGSTQNKQAKIVKFLPGRFVQIEGKKAVRLQDFLNGHPDFPIKNLS